MTRISNADLFGGVTTNVVEDNPALPDSAWRERFVRRFLQRIADPTAERFAAGLALDVVKNRRGYSNPEEAAEKTYGDRR